MTSSQAINHVRGSQAGLVAVLVIMGGATVAAAIAGDGRIFVTLAPMAGAAALVLLWMAPLRKSLLALVLLGLALDKSTDTEGLWHSPVAGLGTLLLENLNKSLNVPFLKVSLLIVLLGYLLLRHVLSALSTYDTDRGSFAEPMRWGLLVSGLTALELCAYGVARGGDLQMGKIQLQVFVPLLLIAYLMACSLRATRDYRRLAAIVVAAACVKSGVALWVRLTLPVVFGEGRGQMPYATTHGDSILFACAIAILAAILFERPAPRHVGVLAMIGLAIVAGVVANNRRLAWVEIASSLALLTAVNLRNRTVRRAIRAGLYAAPLLLAYGVAGWGSSSRIFAPVAMVRSVVDSDSNRSTWYRDAENYDLLATFRANPLHGTGFGQPFETPLPLDSLGDFKEWRYLPHNSILGLWAFTGGLGFTGLWCALVIGLMLAARSHRWARTPDERVAAAAAMGTIVIYTIHCWGDIGFTEQKSIFLVGPALAMAGQLAITTGAWRTRESSVVLMRGTTSR